MKYMIYRALRGSMPIAMGIAAVNAVMMVAVMQVPVGSDYFNSMITGALAGGWVGGFAFCMVMEVMKKRQYDEYMKQHGGKAAKSGGAKKRKK
ncbi:MAG: hypothetical protein II242_06450 [Peptococcaceae bacterium]|nr:hypothetical protein [Peptococcaceae bacterium]